MGKIPWWIFVLFGATFGVLTQVAMNELWDDSSPVAAESSTWMVYTDGHQRLTNEAALEKWFRDRKVWALSRGGGRYVLRLNCNDESATRSELLKVAEEAMASLPNTSGVDVVVETLEKAIEDKRGTIRMYEEEIVKLRAKHTK